MILKTRPKPPAFRVGWYLDSLSLLPRPKQLSHFVLLTGRSTQPVSALTCAPRLARNTSQRFLQARALDSWPLCRQKPGGLAHVLLVHGLKVFLLPDFLDLIVRGTSFVAPNNSKHWTYFWPIRNPLRKGDFEELPYIWQPWLLDQESRWTFASRRQFLCGEISISSLCPARCIQS